MAGGRYPRQPETRRFSSPFGGVYTFPFSDSRGRLSLQGYLQAVWRWICAPFCGASRAPPPTEVGENRLACVLHKNQTPHNWLGVRARPVGDAARMTREKIRSLGSEQRYATETTIFSTGSWGPVLGNEVSVEKYRSACPSNKFFESF